MEHGKVTGDVWFVEQMLTIIPSEDSKCRTEHIYINGEYDMPTSLKKIKEGYKGVKEITVIAESGLHGEIYRYGNHGDYWEYVGDTIGYA